MVDGQRVALECDDGPLATASVEVADRDVVVSLELLALRNAQEREWLLWSREHPTLLDATVELVDDAFGTRVQIWSVFHSVSGRRTRPRAGRRPPPPGWE